MSQITTPFPFLRRLPHLLTTSTSTATPHLHLHLRSSSTSSSSPSPSSSCNVLTTTISGTSTSTTRKRFHNLSTVNGNGNRRGVSTSAVVLNSSSSSDSVSVGGREKEGSPLPNTNSNDDYPQTSSESDTNNSNKVEHKSTEAEILANSKARAIKQASQQHKLQLNRQLLKFKHSHQSSTSSHDVTSNSNSNTKIKRYLSFLSSNIHHFNNVNFCTAWTILSDFTDNDNNNGTDNDTYYDNDNDNENDDGGNHRYADTHNRTRDFIRASPVFKMLVDATAKKAREDVTSFTSLLHENPTLSLSILPSSTTPHHLYRHRKKLSTSLFFSSNNYAPIIRSLGKLSVKGDAQCFPPDAMRGVGSLLGSVNSLSELIVEECDDRMDVAYLCWGIAKIRSIHASASSNNDDDGNETLSSSSSPFPSPTPFYTALHPRSKWLINSNLTSPISMIIWSHAKSSHHHNIDLFHFLNKKAKYIVNNSTSFDISTMCWSFAELYAERNKVNGGHVGMHMNEYPDGLWMFNEINSHVDWIMQEASVEQIVMIINSAARLGHFGNTIELFDAVLRDGDAIARAASKEQVCMLCWSFGRRFEEGYGTGSSYSAFFEEVFDGEDESIACGVVGDVSYRCLAQITKGVEAVYTQKGEAQNNGDSNGDDDENSYATAMFSVKDKTSKSPQRFIAKAFEKASGLLPPSKKNKKKKASTNNNQINLLPYLRKVNSESSKYLKIADKKDIKTVELTRALFALSEYSNYTMLEFFGGLEVMLPGMYSNSNSNSNMTMNANELTQELIQTIVCFARLGLPCPSIFSTLTTDPSFLKHTIDTSSPKALSDIVWSAAQLDLKCPELFRGVIRRIESDGGGGRLMERKDMIRMLWSVVILFDSRSNSDGDNDDDEQVAFVRKMWATATTRKHEDVEWGEVYGEEELVMLHQVQLVCEVHDDECSGGGGGGEEKSEHGHGQERHVVLGLGRADEELQELMVGEMNKLLDRGKG